MTTKKKTASPTKAPTGGKATHKKAPAHAAAMTAITGTQWSILQYRGVNDIAGSNPEAIATAQLNADNTLVITSHFISKAPSVAKIVAPMEIDPGTFEHVQARGLPWMVLGEAGQGTSIMTHYAVGQLNAATTTIVLPDPTINPITPPAFWLLRESLGPGDTDGGRAVGVVEIAADWSLTLHVPKARSLRSNKTFVLAPLTTGSTGTDWIRALGASHLIPASTVTPSITNPYAGKRQWFPGWHTVWKDQNMTQLAWAVWVDLSLNEYWYQGGGIAAETVFSYYVSANEQDYTPPAGFTESYYAFTVGSGKFNKNLQAYYTLLDTNSPLGTPAALIGLAKNAGGVLTGMTVWLTTASNYGGIQDTGKQDKLVFAVSTSPQNDFNKLVAVAEWDYAIKVL